MLCFLQDVVTACIKHPSYDHLINQHQMNQSLCCKHGSILQEKKINIFFGSFYCFFVLS
jgi:hypothetical protein